MKTYDAIVVGAGSGGNIGVPTPQKNGKQPLLLEKHNITGGTGSFFRRGRFERELDALTEQGACRVHYVLSDPEESTSYRTGFITAELLQEIARDVNGCTFYLCGPTPMYHFVDGELAKLGVPRRAIRLEVEVPPADPTRFPGWPQGVDSSTSFAITLIDGRILPAKATETIMQSLERAGVVVPDLCRSRECSTCRTKLVAGKVFHPGTELLWKSDMNLGYIHPCVTCPMEDITLLLPGQ